MDGEDALGVFPQSREKKTGAEYFPSITNPLNHAILNKLKTK